jgi:uncharacterized membrane protein
MINPWKIIGKVAKYLIAVVLTMLLWNLGGSMVTEKDTFAVVGGFGVYFAILAMWVIIVAKEINAAAKKVMDTEDEKPE